MKKKISTLKSTHPTWHFWILLFLHTYPSSIGNTIFLLRAFLHSTRYNNDEEIKSFRNVTKVNVSDWPCNRFIAVGHCFADPAKAELGPRTASLRRILIRPWWTAPWPRRQWPAAPYQEALTLITSTRPLPECPPASWGTPTAVGPTLPWAEGTPGRGTPHLMRQTMPSPRTSLNFTKRRKRTESKWRLRDDVSKSRKTPASMTSWPASQNCEKQLKSAIDSMWCPPTLTAPVPWARPWLPRQLLRRRPEYRG